MNKPRLVRAAYFIWMVVPVAVYAAYLTFGLPHLLWSYDWTATGPDSFSDFAQRHYTSCSYIGPYGPITVHSLDGTCPILRFAKQREA